MEHFTKESLKHLQDLSKIKLTEKEEVSLIEDLKKILNYFESLQKVDTKDVLPCNFVLKDLQRNIMRKDEIKKTISADLFLSNVEEKISQMVKVPSILEDNR